MSFSNRPLVTFNDAIRHFVQCMDIEMIELLLTEVREETAGDHATLVRQLNRAFSYFNRRGDKYLNAIQGQCVDCYPNSYGFYFRGNKSKCHMNLLFHTNEDGSMSFFECSTFKISFSFKKSGKRVYLDDDSFLTKTLGKKKRKG